MVGEDLRDLFRKIALLVLADQRSALAILAASLLGISVDRGATLIGDQNVPKSYILSIVTEARKHLDSEGMSKLAAVIARAINEIEPILVRGLRGSKCRICKRGVGMRGFIHLQRRHMDRVMEVEKMLIEWFEKDLGDYVTLDLILSSLRAQLRSR